ncbi:unnamed protein product, partial [Closterium sp. Yama58-4]
MAEAIRDAPLPPCPWGQARIDGNCAGVCFTPLPLACYTWLHPEFLHAYKCKFAGCGTDSVCKKNDTGDAVCVCINPEYVLQPDKSCAHPCAGTWCAMDDPNSSCVKQEGQLATCVCNWGFAMTPDRGCVDSCTLKACVDGTCSKDENGMAVCSCDAEAGFKLQLDGRTCKDVCVIEDCEGKDANSTCVRNLDVAHCVCKTNFQLFEGVCTDTCEVKACVDGTCTQDVNGTASCHCDAYAGLVLLDDERTCQDVCIIKDCEGSDANSTCVKNGIVATCVCKTGFELFDGKCTGTLPALTFCVPGSASLCVRLCICFLLLCPLWIGLLLNPLHPSFHIPSASALTDTCEVKACVDGTCTQDVNGTASCHCDADAGLVLLDDERTCQDVCIIKDCEGSDANSMCVKNGIVATCVCKTGFELFEGKCTGTLPALTFCVPGSASLCVHMLVFVTFLSFLINLLLNHPSFHFSLTPALTDTCEVKACVDGTCTQDVNGTASCHCDADAGLVLLDDERTCQDVCVIEDCEGKDAKSMCVRNRDVAHCECVINYELLQGVCTDVCIIKDCEGSDANSTCVKNGTDATCVCKTGFNLFEGKCIDTCELKGCGVNGKCHKDSTTGEPSCVCDLGFTLQPDGTTCKDNCEILSCTGPKEHCAKEVTTGQAYCKCDDYFHRAVGGFCQDWCPFKGCNTTISTCVRRVDGIPFCICNKGVPLTTKACV